MASLKSFWVLTLSIVALSASAWMAVEGARTREIYAEAGLAPAVATTPTQTRP